MSKMHRAQILLDPKQHSALAKIAEQEGTSISEIVRNAVDEWLTERQEDEVRQKRLADLEIIRSHRQEILDRRGGKPLEIDVAALIEQMRDERSAELLAAAFGDAQDNAYGEEHDNDEDRGD